MLVVSRLRMMMVRCCWTDTRVPYVSMCASWDNDIHRASPTNSAKLYIIRHSRQQSRATTTTLFFILLYFHKHAHMNPPPITYSHRMWICDALADSVLKRAINTMFSIFCNLNAFTRIFCTCFLSHCAFGEQRLMLRLLSTIF